MHGNRLPALGPAAGAAGSDYAVETAGRGWIVGATAAILDSVAPEHHWRCLRAGWRSPGPQVAVRQGAVLCLVLQAARQAALQARCLSGAWSWMAPGPTGARAAAVVAFAAAAIAAASGAAVAAAADGQTCRAVGVAQYHTLRDWWMLQTPVAGNVAMQPCGAAALEPGEDVQDHLVRG